MIVPAKEKKWLLEKIRGLTEEKQTMLVSEYAEAVRSFPSGSVYPGPYRCDRTPYLTDPMDAISETSSTEFEVWLKGHQLGFTTAVENAILYIIKHAPSAILYTTATDELGKQWSENKLDPAIEQAGLGNMIFSQTRKRRSKKTGDKTLLKEFPGGYIKIAGYGSTSAFRSTSYRYFFGDEIDEASADLKGQGNTIDIAEGRTSAYKSKRKIILFSTPVEKDISNVYKAYLVGDQRKYYVPCPHCGHMQLLDFYRLEYQQDEDGILDVDSVLMRCESGTCKKEIYNHHKTGMYSSGECEWRPTAKAKRANYVSRQISCLYSPAGMVTWADVIQKYIDALESEDPAKMKAFVTLWLGEPYEEKGEAPEYQKVISHRSGYRSKTVPDDVLFLTLGGDVQGDRIELEVCGHGRKFKTWSIDYVVIPGDTRLVSDGAWAKFAEKFLSGDFIYQNDIGEKFAPQMAFIDSNYRTDTVVEFCEGMTGLYPIIGQDKFSNAQQKFMVTNIVGSPMRSIRISTDHFKDLLYKSLSTERMPGHPTPPNYPEFPFDYDDNYFKMLNAEYKRRVKKGGKIYYEYYCPKGRRNEAADCRVYNLGARWYLYHLIIEEQLKDKIEEFQTRNRRKITNSEIGELFCIYMEAVGSFK